MILKKMTKSRNMVNQTEFLQPNITIEYLPHGSDMPYRIVVENNPVNRIDPLGLYSFNDFLYHSANLAAGFGDMISFGGTAAIRRTWEDNLDWENPVDQCSLNYKIGNFLGETWWSAAGVEFFSGWRWMPNAKGFEKTWVKDPMKMNDIRTGWHRLPESKKWWSGKNLPHLHKRPGIGRHRPYE